MKDRTRLLSTLLPILLLSAMPAGGAPVRLRMASPANRNAGRTAAAPDGRLAYIVELRTPPLAKALAAAAPGERIGARISGGSPEAVEAAGRLAAEQESFVRDQSARLAGFSAGARYRNVLNGVAVLVSPESVASLRQDPRVRALHPVRRYRLNLDASNPAMNAPAFWDSLGGDASAGLGVKIGMLDTGIDFSNPMFSDPSLPMPAGFPRENDGNAFANSKVIVAKYFQSIVEQTDPTLNLGHRTAQDLSGHGSHTSGCAAGTKSVLSGSGRRSTTLEGVAPKAYLGDYRVFAPSAYTDNIIAAIDEAVGDGMDAINMSFGLTNPDGTEPFLWGDAVENEAIQNGIAAGMVVTVSAGNSGQDANGNPLPDSIGSTADVPDVIAVGATSNTHEGATTDGSGLIQMTSGHAPPPAPITHLVGVRGGGDNPPPFPATAFSAPFADWDDYDGSTNGTGCQPLPGSPLSGLVVLIQRGGPDGGSSCSFVTKVNNAAAGGARAAVIYNCANCNPASSNDHLVFMDVSGTSIPSLFLGRTDGLNLKGFLHANAGSPPASVGTFGPSSEPAVGSGFAAHDLASFSSLGPTIDLQIKPDLTAVGEGSYAPAEDDDPSGEGRFPLPDPIVDDPLYDASGFTFSQGTSFSAPRVAGSAALLIQKHPDWSPAEIKATLMETAARPTDPSDASRVGNLSVMRRGSGDVDLDAASRVGSVVLPPDHSFGRVATRSLPYAGPLSFSFTLENKSAEPATYQVTASDDPLVSSPGVTPTVSPATLTLEPGASGTITLTLSLDSPVVGQNDSEGFVAVSDGGQTIPGVLFVPYWIRVAYANGSAPELQTLQAHMDGSTADQLDVDFTAHDDDGDVTAFTLGFFDADDNAVASLSDTFVDCCGSGFDGQTDLNVELQLPGLSANVPGAAAIRFTLFDAKGNASGTLYSRFAPPAAAVLSPPAGSSVRVIPLVAHAQGTQFFQSDLRVFNPGAAHLLSLDAYFVPQRQGASSALHTSHFLAPRESLALDDVCLNDFGLSSAVGDLVLVGDAPFLASSRAYARLAKGTAGTLAPGISPDAALDPAQATASVSGMPTQDGFHTNIGITEVTGAPVSVRFEGFDANGISVGAFTDTIPGFANMQYTPYNPLTAGPFGAAPARVDFTIVSGGVIIPYASSVDDGSGDGFFNLARHAEESADDVLITETAHVAGANGTFFTSDLTITNLSAGPRTVELSLLPNFLSGAPASPAPMTLAAGETVTVSDVLATEFGLSGNSAAGIRVHPTAPAALLVSARTFTPAPNGGPGSYGFFVPGDTAANALVAGGRRVSLQIAQERSYRTNFGFAEVLGSPVTVRATFHDAQGTAIGSRAYPLAANATFQTTLGDLVGDATFSNGYIEFTVDGDSGGVLPFAGVIDSTTGDAIYVPGEAEGP